VTAIGIVGTGAVGQAVASALVAAGFPDRLAVLSSGPAQTAACAADLQDMSAALAALVTVHGTGSVSELRDCDAVVVCVRAAFTTREGADIRLGGLHANSRIVHDLALGLRGHPGVVLMVTNPVDILARLAATVSGCRVYGIGAGLDTVRYRTLLASSYDVPTWAVTGDVIGEHGDAAVCCLSTTRIQHQPIDPDDPRTRQAVAAFGHRATSIRTGIGRVRAGAAGAVLAALRAVVGGRDGVHHLSTRDEETGVWLGQPVVFTAGQATTRLPALTKTEHEQFVYAGKKLARAYATVATKISVETPVEEIAQ
jgi:L-lactate dehydrogenase